MQSLIQSTVRTYTLTMSALVVVSLVAFPTFSFATGSTSYTSYVSSESILEYSHEYHDDSDDDSDYGSHDEDDHDDDSYDDSEDSYDEDGHDDSDDSYDSSYYPHEEPTLPYKGCALQISKSTSAVNPKVGDTITYTINFKNTGTGNCTGGGVKVADVLPRGVTYMNETHSSNVTAGYGSFGTYNAAHNAVYWNAATLVPGESGSVTVTVKINEPATCGAFTIENKAKITAFELNEFSIWIESENVKTTVAHPCHVPAPVCAFDVAPLTITRGQSATLSWTTGNATNVSIDQNVGTVQQNGSVSVSPVATTIYTLTAAGANETVTCTKTVSVNEPEPGALTCDAFTATPGTLSSAGNATLSWGTSNATAVAIDNGVGSVDLDGTKVVPVTQNTTYTLTATRGTETKTCVTSVTITPQEVAPRCDAFTATPNSVRAGNTVVLSWGTTDATNVSIDQGIGAVSVDGSESVTVNGNTTYTLTATRGALTTSCQVNVAIETSGGGGGGGGSSSPRCELDASDTRVKAGEKVTLSWKNLRTNDILLVDNRGNKLADSKKDKDVNEDRDSIVVRPTKTTQYELTAIRGSKERTCKVTINVEGVTVTSTRTNDPLVAGISLSRLPYTGFDAGPALTIAFYVLLTLWALVVAYILVVRRGSVFGVTLSTNANTHAETVKDTPRVSIHPSIVVPTMHTAAPEVSRTAYVPSPLREPRVLPTKDMASKHAPVGYAAYYENYDAPASASIEIANLPVGAPTAFTGGAETLPDDIETLESRAHDAHVLISTDALNFIIAQSNTLEERIELLDMIVSVAKSHYPKEDGWVVVNKERILTLLK